VNIYTSSYLFTEMTGCRNLVSISGWQPDGWRHRKYPKLAPKRWIYDRYRETGDELEYAMQYGIHVLSHLNPEIVASELGSGAVLCCYESEGFCHRHLVSRWFRQYGVSCEELTAKHLMLPNF
jgi:hypothetical protein